MPAAQPQPLLPLSGCCCRQPLSQAAGAAARLSLGHPAAVSARAGCPLESGCGPWRGACRVRLLLRLPMRHFVKRERCLNGGARRARGRQRRRERFPTPPHAVTASSCGPAACPTGLKSPCAPQHCPCVQHYLHDVLWCVCGGVYQRPPLSHGQSQLNSSASPGLVVQREPRSQRSA